MNELTVNLNSIHKKAEFNSGVDMLDNYLHKQANQDVKRKLSVCFVLLDEPKNLIKGYYTLSNSSINQDLIPTKYQKKLPKSYGSIPATLLGRLAIDIRYKGQGLGKLMLIDALHRCYEISKIIGSYAVIVDPINENAVKFYAKYGFVELPDSGKMFLPLQTINELFE